MWLHLLLSCASPAPAPEGSRAARALEAIAAADRAAAALHAEIAALQGLCDEPRPGLHLDARPAPVVVADMRAHLDRARQDLAELEARLVATRAELLVESGDPEEDP